MFLSSCDISEYKSRFDKFLLNLWSYMNFNQSDSVFKAFPWLEKANNTFKRIFRSTEWRHFIKWFYNNIEFTKKIGMDHVFWLQMQSYVKDYIENYNSKGETFAQNVLSLNLEKDWYWEKHDFMLWYITLANNVLQKFKTEDFWSENINNLMNSIVDRVINTDIKEWQWWVLFNQFLWLYTDNNANILNAIWQFDIATAERLRWTWEQFIEAMTNLFWEPSSMLNWMLTWRLMNGVVNFIWESPFDNPWFFKRLVQKYLIANSFAQLLLKSTVGVWSFILYSLASATQSIINLSSYKKRWYSNIALDNWLKAIWETAWQSSVLSEQSFWALDTTWKEWSWMARMMRYPAFSWFMTWMQNLIWDTLFRYEYKRYAMAQALHNFWVKSADELIFYTDSDGNVSICESCRDELTNEFQRIFFDYIWSWYVEQWTQTTWWSFVRYYWILTQWGTRYVQNTINRLTWSNLQVYRGKALENWYNITWEDIARDLMSNPEVVSERIRIAKAVKRMLRFNRIYGWCDPTDVECMMTKYLWIAYLPSTASQIWHPVMKSIIQTFYEVWLNDNPNLEANEEWFFSNELITSFAHNFLKPMNKMFYLAWLTVDWYKNLVSDDQSFLEAITKTLFDNTSGMLQYLTEEQNNYLAPYWAFTPKSLDWNEEMIFWIWDNVMRKINDVISQSNRVLNYWKTNSARDKVWLLIKELWFVRKILTPVDLEWIKPLIEIIDSDKWVINMSEWKVPWDGTEYFYNHFYEALTKNDRAYWAEFNARWIRTSKYNDQEYTYQEKQLIAKINELEKTGIPRSEAIMKWLQWTLWSETYDNIKMMILNLWEEWKSNKQAVIDAFAHINTRTNVSWVKALWLIAEAEKYNIIRSLWVKSINDIPASKRQSVESSINKMVVEKYWPMLFYADRAQWNEETKWYILEKNPSLYKKLVYQKADERWTISFKDQKLDNIIEAKLLANSEMATWNPDWFYIHNNVASKIWIPKDSSDVNWVGRLINFTNRLRTYMWDKWFAEQTKVNTIAPMLVANHFVMNNVLQDKKLNDIIWQKNVDYFHNIMYKSYDTIKSMPQALDKYKELESIFGKWYKNNNYSWRYYSNDPYSSYNKYKTLYPTLLKRWALNYNNFKNGYTKWDNYPMRSNYSDWESRYLQQRAYRNSIVSERIAIDIQAWGWQFSRKSVNVKINKRKWLSPTDSPKKWFAKFVKNQAVVWSEELLWPKTSWRTNKRVWTRSKAKS